MIEKMEGNFSRKQMIKFIMEEDHAFYKELTDTAISTALWKLTKAQKIKIVIPRKGTSGAIYSRVDRLF
jgi:hypothetical protein